ncbi:MAG: hypothetical protein JWN63_1340 [Candidatus Acidoferrum typicum]|nr:hypothetical protein [Candidatus Acidoferrum typicum]
MLHALPSQALTSIWMSLILKLFASDIIFANHNRQYQLLGMIHQECAPGLRRRFAAARHVFAHAALTDVDAEFEQFAVDARSTQPGFSRHILQIRSRISREMAGRPGWPRRTFQVQNRRKPARCQATTVSGLTMANAERQSRQRWDRQIHNRRSPEVKLGRFLADLRSTPIWWRRAKFSSWTAAPNGGSRTELRGVSREK